MGTIKIYIKLVDGKPEYRDTEMHRGRTITTEVNPGDKIVWNLDQCSGIKELKDLNIIGDTGFFQKPPKKKDFDRWNAKVSKTAKGSIEYKFDIEKCDGSEATIVARSMQSDTTREEDPPKIIIKD